MPWISDSEYHQLKSDHARKERMTCPECGNLYGNQIILRSDERRCRDHLAKCSKCGHHFEVDDSYS